MRNLFVQAGARLVVVGPRPLTVLVSGWARVDGEISLNGSRSDGVTTLGTTNIPEPGAAGNGGGGSGGTGSYLTAQSTPRGGAGFGAFEVPNAGGQGGESGYAPIEKDERRGGGHPLAAGW